MSLGVGTGIYKAPEIDSGNYNYKIDIYSLGIIILELFANFTTYTEKIITLRKFKKDKDDKIFDIIKNEKIKNIIIKTLNFDPQLRPSIADLKNDFENL